MQDVQRRIGNKRGQMNRKLYEATLLPTPKSLSGGFPCKVANYVDFTYVNLSLWSANHHYKGGFVPNSPLFTIAEFFLLNHLQHIGSKSKQVSGKQDSSGSAECGEQWRNKILLTSDAQSHPYMQWI